MTNPNTPVPDDVIEDAKAAGLPVRTRKDGTHHSIWITKNGDFTSKIRCLCELQRQRGAAAPDRNLAGVAEFLMAIVYDKPIWPNTWGQDVAMAAFKLTDGGKRSTATPPTPSSNRELLEKDGYKLLKDSTYQERSWEEDLSHENGNYECVCHYCQRNFTGHKRRSTCKVCALMPKEEGKS